MRSILIVIVCIWATTASGQHTIKQNMDFIRENFHVYFIYDAKVNVDRESRANLSPDAPLRKQLKLLFTGTGISYTFHGNNIVLKRIERVTPTFTVRGKVVTTGGEPMINASIYDITSGIGTCSDEKGRYRINLTPGKHELRASYVGSCEKKEWVEVTGNSIHNFVLDESNALEEVVVYADQNSAVHTIQTGKKTFTHSDINTEFSLMSSPDLIKTLQHVSGVSNGIDLASGLIVHGGTGDENLFLLDGSPLYQTNHSLGLFSAFNTDIIKNVDFYKSGFPARYSGRVSSVTDVRTKDGNLQNIQGTYTIGMLDGRIQIEGPIIKNRTSFNIALRRSWVDLLLKPAYTFINSNSTDGEHFSFGYAFHDFNAKITHHINQSNSLWLSIYSGGDNYGITDNSSWSGYVTETANSFNWGNTNTTLGGDFRLSEHLIANVSLILAYSHSHHNSEENDTYHYDNIIRRFSLDLRENKTKMIDIVGKVDFNSYKFTRHRLKFGCSLTHHIFLPQTTFQTFFYGNPSEKVDTTRILTSCNAKSDEIALYAEDEIRMRSKLSVNYGTSFTLIGVDGKSYVMLDPRFALKFQPTGNISFKASYTHMSQSSHRNASTFLELPTDYWVPTTSYIHPTTSNQIVVGIYSQFINQLSLSAEAFYKISSHILQYRNWMGIQPPAAKWTDNVTEGEGRSYGIDIEGKYYIKKLTLSMAYTLSWSKRLFPELYSKWYDDQFDNRHKLDMMARWRLNKHIALSTSWTFHGGNRMTMPVATIELPSMPGETNNYETGYLYNSPNNFRLPAYHRLDVGADFHSVTRHGHERIWNVSIYNAYCHMNTMYINVGTTEDGGVSAKCKGFIPIIPSVSYTIKF